MVAIVDNTRVMHGRRAYEDPGRDIIMRLSLETLVPAPMAAE
jgi:alpha-ketoglutarate-dependent taurine dioxygenase